MIFSISLERCWIDLYIFREFAKTRKIAPRSSESTKIKGLGGQEWHQNQKITHRNLLQNLKRKIIPKWSQHGRTIEPKRHQQINAFLVRFWNGSGNIDGTATGLRRGCGCHTFSSRPPRAAPYYQRLLYKNKQRALLKG